MLQLRPYRPQCLLAFPGSLLWVGVVLALSSSAALGEGFDYPPALRLKEQAVVAELPVGDGGQMVAQQIERGYEEVLVSIPDGENWRWVTYTTAQKKVFGHPGPKTPEKPKKELPERKLPDGLPEGVKLSQYDEWPGTGVWNFFCSAPGLKSIPEQAKLHEGIGCFAVEGPKADEPARLYVFRRALGKPEEAGPLSPCDGTPPSKVYHVRVLPSSDVAVLAGDGKRTVLQIYENPLIDGFRAQWLAFMDYAFKDEPVLQARNLGSLYDLSPYADRGMDPMLLASDGCPYFGLMPHHPYEGAPVFRFNSKTEKLEFLGDIDRMAGTKKPENAPSMMHVSACEMNGRVYFTGNDPHYGGWGFYPEPGKEKPKYAGPPLAAYVMATGKIEPHGVPLPGHLGVFEIVGDTERNVLYLRPGFSRGHYGPLEWFALSFDAAGKLLGEPKPLPFPQPLPGTIIVGTDGSLYGAMPDAELYGRYHKGGGEKSGIKPRCQVYRCHSGLKVAESVATIDGVWEIEWFLFQDRQPSAIGFSAGRFSAEQCFFRLDLKSGQVEKLAAWPKSLSGAERLLYRNGKVWVSLFQAGRIEGKDLRTRTAGIYSIDPTSGEARYYGVLKDDKGRRPKDLNYFQFLPDGRFFAVGTVHCIPGDKNYMPRDRSQEPFGLDCAAFIVDKLPPGKPF